MLFYNLLQDVLSYVSKIAKLNLFVLFQAYVVSNGLHLSGKGSFLQNNSGLGHHAVCFLFRLCSHICHNVCMPEQNWFAFPLEMMLKRSYSQFVETLLSVSLSLWSSENIIQHGAPVSRHLAPFGRYAAPLTPAKWSFFFACCYARCLLMSVDLGQNLWAVRCILVPWSWNISQEFWSSRELITLCSGNAIVQERKKRRRLKKIHSKFSRRAGCKVMKTATWNCWPGKTSLFSTRSLTICVVHMSPGTFATIFWKVDGNQLLAEPHPGFRHLKSCRLEPVVNLDHIEWSAIFWQDWGYLQISISQFWAWAWWKWCLPNPGLLRQTTFVYTDIFKALLHTIPLVHAVSLELLCFIIMGRIP